MSLANWKKVRDFFTFAQDSKPFGEVATNMLRLSEELETILSHKDLAPNTSLLELVLVISEIEERIRIAWEHDDIFVVYSESVEFRKIVSKDQILETIEELHELLSS